MKKFHLKLDCLLNVNTEKGSIILTYRRNDIEGIYPYPDSNFLTIECINLFLETRLPRMSLYILDIPCLMYAIATESKFPLALFDATFLVMD